MAADSSCVTTVTEVLQLPSAHMDTTGQAAQQIGPIGVEHIKRLIEKMGNVQKVNQLVILGLDQISLHAQGAGMQQLQGLTQPLHFDFTQPTDRQAGDKQGHEGKSGSEQDTLLESLEPGLAVEQKTTAIQSDTTTSAEFPEKQLTLVESDITEAQVNEVQGELLPELPEKDILPPQLEASDQLMLTTEEEQIQDTVDVKILETENDSPLTLITDFESRIMTEKEFVIKSMDITVSAMTNTNDEPSQKDFEPADSLIEVKTQTVQGSAANTHMTNTSADPLSQKAFEAVGLLVEPEPQTGQETLDKPDKTNTNPESQCQKAMEATDSLVEPQPKNPQKNTNLDKTQEMEVHLEQQHLKEILSSEDQILQMNKPSLGNVQHDQERSLLEQAQCSEPSEQQSRVETKDQILLAEDSPYVKKARPVKKKSSKKQVIPKSQYLETQDEVAKSTLPITPNQKIVTVSRTPKKQEKKKKHFGSKQNKRKYSKPKLLNISQNSLHKDQQDTDPGKVPVLSHSEVEKLNQKHKRRKCEKSSGLIQALNLPCEKVMKVSEQAHQRKPQKRKLENQRDLVKKGKSTQETQQDETPVPNKKKTGKISEATQKKAKSNITVTKVSKKSHKLAKQREKDKNVSDTPIIDQIKQQALLLLKGHKQPQLKVHKLDAKTTGLDHQLIQKCQNKEIYSHGTTVEPANEGIQNKSLQAPSQKKKKSKMMGKKSKVDSKQSSHLQTSPVNSDIPSGAKQKVVRKRKSPTKIDQEIALSPPYSRLIIGCHDCGKSFSEVSALQEHMALMHSENGAFQAVVPYDVSEMHTVGLRPNEMLTNSVHLSSFETHVPTDWDVESEMREIGLGDEQRNEHRLSFPALNPSPSFPLMTTFVEGEGKQDDVLNEEPPLGHEKAVGKNSACLVETNESKVGEQENIDKHLLPPLSLSEPQESMKVKEALPSAVNLVMVEDQNEGDSHISNNLYSLSQSNSHKASDPEEGEPSHVVSHNPSLIQNQLPTKPVNPASTYDVGSHFTEQSEIKQEADEASVQTVASQTHTTMTKGKRGRGNKGRGKRQLGKRRSAENRPTEQMVANEKDCQVVFELYSLPDNGEDNEEIPKKRKAINATAASIHSALKEAPEVQEVCMLPQPITASTLDNESLTLMSGENEKNSSFPSRGKRRISVHCQNGMSGQVGFC